MAVLPQTESSLFRLPPEIREKIQRFALTENDLGNAMSITKYPEVLFRASSDPLPEIMCTCKKMYLEMSPFAFTEVIVRETHVPFRSSRTGLMSHGNLRFERLRRVSMVVAYRDGNVAHPAWTGFLFQLLQRSPDVDRLDIEIPENGYREEVENELPAAEERRRTGREEEGDDFILEHYPLPTWMEFIARLPSLRRVSFEGSMPRIWLEGLRRASEGRIQVISDGVRFRERQAPVVSLAGMKDPTERGEQQDLADPQIQIMVEPAERFD